MKETASLQYVNSRLVISLLGLSFRFDSVVLGPSRRCICIGDRYRLRDFNYYLLLLANSSDRISKVRKGVHPLENVDNYEVFSGRTTSSWGLCDMCWFAVFWRGVYLPATITNIPPQSQFSTCSLSALITVRVFYFMTVRSRVYSES